MEKVWTLATDAGLLKRVCPERAMPKLQRRQETLEEKKLEPRRNNAPVRRNAHDQIEPQQNAADNARAGTQPATARPKNHRIRGSRYAAAFSSV
jgi:hypothetical protein